MKSNRAACLVLGVLIPAVFAAQAPAPAPAAKGAPAAAQKVVPPPVKEKEKEKKEEIPPIEGITIPRSNGTYLGLQIVANNFVLKFFDKEKRKAKPDVARAALRWPVRYQPTDERVVLNPSEDTLTSAFVVRPPHLFKLTVSLLSDSPDKPAETYIVDFRE